MPTTHIVLLGLALGSLPLQAAETISFRRDNQVRHVTGRVVVEAVDGGLLVLAPDGVLWEVQPADIVSRQKNAEPFAMLDKEALGKQLLGELPKGFAVHTTANYVICYSTSKAYAEWCGGLFERLHRGYFAYWGQKDDKLKLAEPAYPLVAIIFHDQESFARHARAEVGEAAGSMLGYYSLRTNRMLTYDLTGVQAVRAGGGKRGSAAEINEMLARPAAERTVATIIHEATHQLAFNSGLHQRYGDVPLWWSEGLAMFFESPDLTSEKGWRTIGAVNRVQHARFLAFWPGRKPGSLQALLADASRFRDAAKQEDAYAEAWALHYFLAKKRSEQYLAYLKLLAAKPPALHDEPAQRLKDFTSIFGEDLGKLDAEFVRTMRELR